MAFILGVYMYHHSGVVAPCLNSGFVDGGFHVNPCGTFLWVIAKFYNLSKWFEGEVMLTL